MRSCCSRLRLTVLHDLMTGIIAGFSLSALLFLRRMSEAVLVEGTEEHPHDADTDRDTVVCRISGAFFFGAAASVVAALERIAERPRNVVLDFSAVAIIDSTAAATIAGFVRRLRARRSHGQPVRIFISGASAAVRRELQLHGLPETDVTHAHDVDSALQALQAL